MRQLWIPLYHEAFIMTLFFILWALNMSGYLARKGLPTSTVKVLQHILLLVKTCPFCNITALLKIKTQNKSDFADCIMAPYEVILRKQKYLQYSIPKKNLNRIFLVIQLSVVAMTIISSTPPQFQRQLLKHSCHLHAFRSSPSWSLWTVVIQRPKSYKTGFQRSIKRPIKPQKSAKPFPQQPATTTSFLITERKD